MTKKRPTRFICPVDVALSLIHGKWKPMILWLLAGKKQRFSDLQTAMPGVAHKVLSQQLRQLEGDGVIKRRVMDTPGVRVEYELTDFGRTLRPALNALASWGKAHHRDLGVEYSFAGRRD
ncbi:MAG TPA: helix-turn-helix domain-containing protein [Gammaproteobacteria bacterium]|jgi:DNA-binding HxlR family transcriptional regulator|nr:helix-turn-helix domain-containing protein [Gammaproteobacteria bacterium]